MRPNRWRWSCVLLLLLLLAACGQSEGGQAGQTAAPEDTARALVSRPTATLPGGGGTSAGYSRPLTASVQGEDVSAVQARLIELGYADFSEPNGNYGPKTQAAVTAFQQANGLEADGVVGPKTWAALFDAAAVAKTNTNPPAPPAGDPPTAVASPAPDAPTQAPAAPPPADEPPSAIGGRLLYLADDGASIKSLAIGSTNEESTLATPDLGTGETVTFLTADPSGELVLYGVANETQQVNASRMFQVQPDGSSVLVDIVVGQPSWSPDGSRYAVQLFDYAQNQPYHVVVRGLDGGFFSTELVGSQPRWAADGQHLIWEAGGNLISYDLANSGPTNAAALLTNFPEGYGADSWTILEAAGLADGTVAFYGGPNSDPGLNGNNRGWYTLSGSDPVEWAPAEGAQVFTPALNPAGDLLAYSVRVSAGPCRRNDYLYVRPANPGSPRLDNPNFEFDTSQAVQIEGLSWNPSASQQLAVAMQPYECVGAGEKKFGPAGIYVWDPNEGGSATPAQVATGFYPVWVK